MNFKICEKCGKVNNIFGEVKTKCTCGGDFRDVSYKEKYKIANKVAKGSGCNYNVVVSLPHRDPLTT